MIPTTMITAGILGLIYIALSARVSQMRRKVGISSGDGDGKPEAEPLAVAIRSHANFAEYVPFALILLGLIESDVPVLTLILAIMLVLGRLAHPVGMTMPAPNVFRLAGILLTWLVILIAAVTAVIRGLAWA